jgi:hypothetical protein
VGLSRLNFFIFFFKFHLKLIRSETELPKLKKFEVKYGAEGFELTNNCSYCNRSRIEMEFELKFREASRC